MGICTWFSKKQGTCLYHNMQKHKNYQTGKPVAPCKNHCKAAISMWGYYNTTCCCHASKKIKISTFPQFFPYKHFPFFEQINFQSTRRLSARSHLANQKNFHIFCLDKKIFLLVFSICRGYSLFLKQRVPILIKNVFHSFSPNRFLIVEKL